MSEKNIYQLIDDLNIPHYPTSAIVSLLKKLKAGSMGTISCDHFVSYGTKKLTHKMLKRLESIGLVKSKKNALNEYQWSITELCEIYLLPIKL